MAPEMQRYFESLGLEIWDVWSFFKLLDTDEDGHVRAEDFLNGCLRFSGQASAVDVGRPLALPWRRF